MTIPNEGFVMTCPELELFDRFAMGQLSGDESSSVQGHLDACSSCAAHFLEIRENVGQFGRLKELLRPESRRGSESELPERVGSYRVLREIGRGGMGVVYLAEQARPQRTVAIKLIRAELLTDERRRRFDRETELIGRLRHPGIAQVYEAGRAEVTLHGRTDAPQPYLAMEYVEGRRLDEFAEHHALSIADRIELLVKVCEAVHHAHVHGVIHRDLKPANVLVEAAERRCDAATKEKTVKPSPSVASSLGRLVATPKILDFGVAKATEPDGLGPTIEMSGAQLLGTVPYMSPEQVTGDSRTVDARADVYALGVIGYRLLTGKHPYDLHDRSLLQAIETIRERHPARPSALNGTVSADLDAIVLKAMAKSPSERYQSAHELGADLHRYLRHEPVEARSPSTGYLLAKFAVRHRALVGTVAVAFALLCTLTLMAVIQANQATEARGFAERRLDDSLHMTEYLLRGVSSQLADIPGTEKVRRHLTESAYSFFRSQLEENPGNAELAIGVLDSIRVLIRHASDRGDHPRMDELLEELAQRADDLLESDPDDSEVRLAVADVYHTEAKWLRARGNETDSRSRYRDALNLLNDLASPDADQLPPPEEMLAQTIAERGRPPVVIRAKKSLMTTYDALSHLESPDCDDEYGSGHLRRAVELQHELLEIDPTVEPIVLDRKSNPYGVMTRDVTLHAGSGPSHRRNLVDLMLSQARLLEDCDRLDEADRIYEQIEAGAAELLAMNPTVPANVSRAATVQIRLAQWSERRGRLDSALEYAKQAVELREQLSFADPSNIPAQNALTDCRNLVEKYSIGPDPSLRD